MVNEKEVFDAFIAGDYNCISNELRELFILAVINQDKDEIIVRKYTRPTELEDAVYYLKLQGLQIEFEVNTKKSWSIFTRAYKITINTSAFLSNLPIFYQTTREQLEYRYNIIELMRNKPKDSKAPRDREILLFKRDINDKVILKQW